MAPMPPDEYPNRIKRARALMRERGMDGLIVTDAMHYSYYTGHKVASWMRSRPSIFVLPLEGRAGADHLVRARTCLPELYRQPFPSWVRIAASIRRCRSPRSRASIGASRHILKEGLDAATIGIELGRETWLGIAVVDFELLKEQLPKAQFDRTPVRSSGVAD